MLPTGQPKSDGDDRHAPAAIADDRLPMAKAYQRATRGMTVAVSMVLPGLLGYWVDSKLGTRGILTIVGFAFGMAYGILELVRMGHRAKRPAEPDERAEERTTPDK